MVSAYVQHAGRVLLLLASIIVSWYAVEMFWLWGEIQVVGYCKPLFQIGIMLCIAWGFVKYKVIG